MWIAKTFQIHKWKISNAGHHCIKKFSKVCCNLFFFFSLLLVFIWWCTNMFCFNQRVVWKVLTMCLESSKCNFCKITEIAFIVISINHSKKSKNKSLQFCTVLHLLSSHLTHFWKKWDWQDRSLNQSEDSNCQILCQILFLSESSVSPGLPVQTSLKLCSNLAQT